MFAVDYDLDYVVSSDSDSDFDYSDESIPQPVRFKAKKRSSRRNRGGDSKVGSIPINSVLQVEKNDLIVYEGKDLKIKVSEVHATATER